VSEPVRIEFDVTAVAPAGATVEVGDLFLPEGATEAASVDLVVCVPGGGMTRRWFDLPESLPGRWSLARHLADDHGLAVLTLDHLGTGDSPSPDDPYTLIPRVVAAVHAHVVAEAVARLRAGDLVTGVGPMTVGRVVGCGHSMGAMITVQQQARHRSYDAVVLLGFGGAGLPEHLNDEERGYAGDLDELELALPTLVAARFGGALAPSKREVRERPAGEPLIPGDLLGPATGALLTLGGLTSMIPGTSDREMAAIDVPVLAAVGENDIVREVERLPLLFSSTPELTEFVLPGSGHNHVIAAERLLLFDEIGRWVGTLPQPSGGSRRRG
jgi:pimeloyl-ACP methyl ester carboxylesterase